MLLGFRRKAAAQELGVDADEAPPAELMDPAVGSVVAEIASPALLRDPLVHIGLGPAVAQVGPGNLNAGELRPHEGVIGIVVRIVEDEIPGHGDEIGPLAVDVGEASPPARVVVGPLGAEMQVGDLNDVTTFHPILDLR